MIKWTRKGSVYNYFTQFCSMKANYDFMCFLITMYDHHCPTTNNLFVTLRMYFLLINDLHNIVNMVKVSTTWHFVLSTYTDLRISCA